MKKGHGLIGFDRKLKLAWLDGIADMVSQGLSVGEVRRQLDVLLGDAVAGTSPGSAKGKTKTVLVRVWKLVPSGLGEFRDEGLEHLKKSKPDQRIAVHWGMVMAAYPFFATVAAIVGRLLRLQDVVAAAQVRRRAQEQIGDREIVARATQHILRCFVDWAVLEDAGKKGVYRPATPIRLADRQLAVWLIEAALSANCPSSCPLGAVAEIPAMYPFAMPPLANSDVLSSRGLDLLPHGLGDYVVVRVQREDPG